MPFFTTIRMSSSYNDPVVNITIKRMGGPPLYFTLSNIVFIFASMLINVDTDLRLAATGAVRKFLFESPKEFDVRKYLGPARETMAKVIASRMEAFGCAGHAGDYEPKTLEDYKKVYGF